jgi:hypothetical protein
MAASRKEQPAAVETPEVAQAAVAETPVSPAPAAAVETPEVGEGLFVAPGLSITCARGHLDEGTPVSAGDFWGQEALDDLIARGAVVRR